MKWPQVVLAVCEENMYATKYRNEPRQWSATALSMEFHFDPALLKLSMRSNVWQNVILISLSTFWLHSGYHRCSLTMHF